MIICSQNLYGLVFFDDFEPVNYFFTGTHANGIAYKDGYIYLADYNSIQKIKDFKIVETINGKGWDNIHTLFFDGNDMLIASTSNNRAYRNEELILQFPQDHYHNSLIPYDGGYVIGLRNPKVVLLYDKKEGKVVKEIRLPFLHNMHSATHYKDDIFLVSDGDGVVEFDIDGKPIKKSPHMNWPRGIKVVDEYAYVVDRNMLYEWDVENNVITRQVRNPIQESLFGAFFDLVIV
ncbi:MAG: hypothetical protein QXV17_06580 [Candidatus Micrarchaeaceae archaeon]